MGNTMNDQQETTANTPSEPKLCRMGCGFFGSNATGDCCSKCFNEMKNAQGTPVAPASAAVETPQPPAIATTSHTPAPVAAEVTIAVAEEKAPSSAPSPTKKKKKKKKKVNYKDMIAGMMEQSGPRDAEKEKESIKKVTGGGNFVKIDKI